ncbi:Ragulator complex protein LAMTOR5 [Pseudolycoriella hygida]|uniref:Late endosomal/lysosomal adaptor and MAPK and MTOR activator 5 n=1 Tax=Pseudolycoriella hygida TaxID=35572 RepID=A0A9Q0MSX1_9DIPT|nr:Ragulator complex protein LAMTOR5 [Pseudolycoriella hygida]
MEQDIDNVLKGIMSSSTTVGCLVANNQGLCIEKRGDISPNTAGLATAILCQASKLEPNSNAPIVALETGKKTCLIHKHGITGVVYKEVAKQGAR